MQQHLCVPVGPALARASGIVRARGVLDAEMRQLRGLAYRSDYRKGLLDAYAPNQIRTNEVKLNQINCNAAASEVVAAAACVSTHACVRTSPRAE